MPASHDASLARRRIKIATENTEITEHSLLTSLNLLTYFHGSPSLRRMKIFSLLPYCLSALVPIFTAACHDGDAPSPGNE